MMSEWPAHVCLFRRHPCLISPSVLLPSTCPPRQRVDTGFGKLVYARNFLNSLIPKMMRKSLTDPQVAEVIDLERLQKVTTIGKDCVRCRARLALSYVCIEVFRMVGVLAAYLETQDTTLYLNLTSNLPLRWAMVRSHVGWCVQLIGTAAGTAAAAECLSA